MEHSSTGLNQNESLISLFPANFVRSFMRDFSEPEELLAELQCFIVLNGETYISRTETVRERIINLLYYPLTLTLFPGGEGIDLEPLPRGEIAIFIYRVER